MITSHKGQILPLKKQLIPISKNTTLHASYAKNLYGFNQGVAINPHGFLNSYNFDGNDSSYVSLSDSIDFSSDDFSSGFTIEAWVKPTSPGISVIFSSALSGDGSQWQVYLWYNADNKFYVAQRYNPGNQNDFSTVNTFAPNTFYHVAVTWDGTTTRLYVNGVLENSNAGGRPIGVSAQGREVRIGNFKGYGTSNTFKGNISDVRVWKYTRTVEQISHFMHKELDGSETGLVGYWKLNELSTDMSYDSSLNNNDGTVNGNVILSEGRTVSTPKIDGKFIGSAAIEEGSTNLFQNGDFSDGVNHWVFGSWDSANYNYYVTDCHNLRGFTKCMRIDRLLAGGAADFHQGDIYQQSVVYAMSAWVRGDGTLTLNSHWGIIKTITLTSEWQWVSGTITSSATDGQYAYFTVSGISTFIEITGCQIEQKNFSTSYMNGSRSSGLLYYPKETLNPTLFTISCWFNIPYMHRESTGHTGITGNWYHPIIEWCPTTSRGDTGYSVVAGPEPSSFDRKIMLRYPGAVQQGIAIQDNVWYHLVALFDGSNHKIYINGDIQIDWPNLGAPIEYDDTVLMVGGGYFGGPNIYISELRIEDVAISEDEVLAWYQSDAPFYNYLDYSEVAY